MGTGCMFLCQIFLFLLYFLEYLKIMNSSLCCVCDFCSGEGTCKPPRWLDTVGALQLQALDTN